MALTAADLDDARRFAGYPVAGALAFLDAPTLDASKRLDAVLMVLPATSVTTVQTMLTALRLLDADVPAMRDGLDTAQAAVWKRNPAELAERSDLLLVMRRRFCAYLGVPPGPGVFIETPAGIASAVFTV